MSNNNENAIQVYLLMDADEKPCFTLSMNHVPRQGDYFDLDVRIFTGAEGHFTPEYLDKVRHLTKRLRCAPAWQVTSVMFRCTESYHGLGNGRGTHQMAFIRIAPAKAF